jgi:hypothetical protein
MLAAEPMPLLILIMIGAVVLAGMLAGALWAALAERRASRH